MSQNGAARSCHWSKNHFSIDTDQSWGFAIQSNGNVSSRFVPGCTVAPFVCARTTKMKAASSMYAMAWLLVVHAMFDYCSAQSLKAPPPIYPYDIMLGVEGSSFQLTYVPQGNIYDYNNVWFYNGPSSIYPDIPRVCNVPINVPFPGNVVPCNPTATCSGDTPVNYTSYAVLVSGSVEIKTSVIVTTVVCGYSYSSPCEGGGPSQCVNGGECDSTTNQCKCLSGFAGKKCELIASNFELSGNEICQGYMNQPCNVGTSQANPCQNGGQVSYVDVNLDGHQSTGYVCFCPETFAGVDCSYQLIPPQTSCNNNPCANGVCHDYDNATYFCTCNPGYAGARCDSLIAAQSCEQRPCVHGSCYAMPDKQPQFYCQCPVDYSGERCDISVAPSDSMCENNPCLNDGTCIIARDNGGPAKYRYCQCKGNWIGPFCEFQGHSRMISIQNQCEFKVWPAIQGNPLPLKGGFELDVGSTVKFSVPTNWISTRVWGRTNCMDVTVGDKIVLVCQTGDCEAGLECGGSGSKNVTLAEFTLGTSDTYDVSLVDGFNLPIAIIPSHFPLVARAQDELIYAQCRETYCVNNINLACSDTYAVKNATSVIGCLSACAKFGTDEACCKGAFATPETCPRPSMDQIAKDLCPLAYTYAYDDRSSTFTCPNYAEPDYSIVFCPTKYTGAAWSARNGHGQLIFLFILLLSSIIC